MSSTAIVTYKLRRAVEDLGLELCLTQTPLQHLWLVVPCQQSQ